MCTDNDMTMQQSRHVLLPNDLHIRQESHINSRVLSALFCRLGVLNRSLRHGVQNYNRCIVDTMYCVNRIISTAGPQQLSR